MHNHGGCWQGDRLDEGEGGMREESVCDCEALGKRGGEEWRVIAVCGDGGLKSEEVKLGVKQFYRC